MEKNIGNVNKPQELKDWAYSSIKKAVLNGEIPPGQQLHVEELAEKMNISRTPIRDALIMLEHEGLISVASRVGFFVKGITKNELEELFELRELLESYAAQKAAGKLTPKDLEKIGALLKEGGDAVDRGDLSGFLQTEIELHSSIQAHAQNKHLLRMIESLKDLTYRERLLSVTSQENVTESLREHERILEAFKQRDGRQAAEMMREHIRNVKGRVLMLVDAIEEDKG
jgi:DNA-binding GntR family transcriptional regulator